jgi:hypothetical protein
MLTGLFCKVATDAETRSCQIIHRQNPHLYQRDAEKIVDAILAEIVAAMARGDRVGVRQFFCEASIASGREESRERCRGGHREEAASVLQSGQGESLSGSLGAMFNAASMSACLLSTFLSNPATPPSSCLARWAF